MVWAADRARTHRPTYRAVLGPVEQLVEARPQQRERVRERQRALDVDRGRERRFG